jgi:phage terminase large subunit-like protein
MADEITESWVKNESDRLAIAAGCWFSVEHAEKPCIFAERYCHNSKGRWAGQKIVLITWERDFLQRCFGWRRPDGTRRFRSAYIEIAKKNGKSTLMSVASLYLVLADDEGAPEVYLNAASRDQASIIFDEAARMVRRSPALAKRVEVIDSRKTIVAGDGKIVANSSDADKRDGPNASGVIFDEVHRLPDRELWDVFEYATLARSQPLRIAITTAGEDEDGVWFEQRRYSEQVESGIIPDIEHLGIVFRALETDDIDDPATWKKANPSLGITLTEDDFRADLEEAKAVPAKLGNFKRLRLNIVTRAAGKFVDMKDWDACNAPPSASPGEPSYMGIDLSSRNDLTAVVWITGSFATGFNVNCRFWLPREGVAKLEAQHQVPYRTWAGMGLITLTAGNTIDLDFVEAEIVRLSTTLDLVKIMADQFNGKKMCESLLNKHGLPVEYLRQGYLSLSDPSKTLADMITGHKLRHGGHPILRWHASNAVADQDPAGNIKLNKARSKQKIDGMAALVNAVAGAISMPDDEESVYEYHGIQYL